MAPLRGWRLGAQVSLGKKSRFAISAPEATSVTLALFQRHGEQPSQLIALKAAENGIWQVELDALPHGTLYGFLADGPWQPKQGLRFNRQKLLIDPYAAAVHGLPDAPPPEAYSYHFESGDDLICDQRPYLDLAPKSVLIHQDFDWGADAPPAVDPGRRVIYELQLRGFSKKTGSEHSGTYLGLCEQIPHLLQLGVTSVEIMPVMAAAGDNRLPGLGLRDLWGYNSVAFLAPDPRFRHGDVIGDEVRQFRQMVKELHAAGLEVILDIVLNHSGEGGRLGPSYNLKGLDNRGYYRLEGPGDEPGRHYQNQSGCGNTLNLDKPQMLTLALDTLRYWVQEMHVDGFRFDLATLLALHGDGFSDTAPFLDAVAQEPALRGIFLAAEPWHFGMHALGRFQGNFHEWNDWFRDTARRFWRGDAGQIAALATRMSGSPDLFRRPGRVNGASINLITCHDGFTLNDLVSYNERHNEDNGEENRDGAAGNFSQNCGVEGETSDEAVLKKRATLQKSLLATLLVSAGTPLLRGGDELGQTQKGNNNAYCQDNEISWLNWSDKKLVSFIGTLNSWVRGEPQLLSPFLVGAGEAGTTATWHDHTGQTPDWSNPELRHLCLRLQAPGRGTVLVALNGSDEPVELSAPLFGPQQWKLLLDTCQHDELSLQGHAMVNGSYLLAAKALALFETL